MQKRAPFNQTGSMIAALVIVEHAAAVASETPDPGIGPDGVAGSAAWGWTRTSRGGNA